MQTQKEEIRERILFYAKDEFLKKGFKGASMRDIASRADVSLSNIYNYFKNKDKIFCAVLEPLLEAFDKMEKEHNREDYLSIEIFEDEDYQRENILYFMNIIKKFRSELKILLFMSFGSSLENFRDTFTDRHTQMSIGYLKSLKAKYPEINIDISLFFMHTISSWWLTILGEIISHDELKDNDIEQFLKDYTIFSTAGWKKIMNVK
ncbi:TetR/AcrR family transcriptional regulator [Weeksellaceae bacterium TAE3-ERU29]|nr:TetR/AcrR family transcriptional regulator [Weeksellaceae bacterium TAE3-ERU29]